MTKKFCDRCKRELTSKNIGNIKISVSDGEKHLYKTILAKEICEECAVNMANSIDYECDRHILRPTVIISKEADDSNV